MAPLPTYFIDFLTDIRPTKNQRDDLIRGHKTLRERLLADKTLASIIVNTFLQGSYRRSTAIRPRLDKRSDVDVVVVTKLDRNEYQDPNTAMEIFLPFVERHYKDKYVIQGRSIGIELSYVDLDLVITAAPSESEVGILKSDSVTTDATLEEALDWRLVKSWLAPEHRSSLNATYKLREAATEPEWKTEPLYIPNRDAKKWEPTHPLEQIRWTREKNQRCNGHYINVVKAIKWHRRVQHQTPKYPKGYPLEHLIGVCCPDGITSVAEGVTTTLEAIATNYWWNAFFQRTPSLPDHGVPSHNVMQRVSGGEFAEFYEQIAEAAKLARRAFDETDIETSVDLWRQLFGDKFPPIDDGGTKRGGFTPRTDTTTIGGGRFA